MLKFINSDFFLVVCCFSFFFFFVCFICFSNCLLYFVVKMICIFFLMSFEPCILSAWFDIYRITCGCDLNMQKLAKCLFLFLASVNFFFFFNSLIEQSQRVSKRNKNKCFPRNLFRFFIC